MDKVVTRIAPSPTGALHVGTARTALFNWLFARKMGGKFILRIEDTDKERSKKEFEDDILDGLKWLGLSGDEFFRQSERSDIYERHIRKMVDDGLAYVSDEEGEDKKRKEVIRFKNPNRTVVFDDLLRGEISFDTKELGDFVIARNLRDPLYHLAVVVDDFEMGVSHVIRGEDGISNTPRQILLLEAIGAKRPIYVHVPFILGPDKTKLSKRHGAVSLLSYKEEGFLPEALLNYLALLGWHPEGDKEMFTIEELIEQFDLSRVQKGGAIFDKQKLLWMNREYIKNLSFEKKVELAEKWVPPNFSSQILKNKEVIDLLFERIETLSDIKKMAEEGHLDWMDKKPKSDKNLLLGKKQEIDNITVKENLSIGSEILNNLGSWNKDNIKLALMKEADARGRGNFLWPLRVALSGQEKSPDPFIMASILGKDETILRIKDAIDELG